MSTTHDFTLPDGTTRRVTLRRDGTTVHAEVDGQALTLTVTESPAGLLLEGDGRRVLAHTSRVGDRVHVKLGAEPAAWVSISKRAGRASAHDAGGLESPMPGTVLAVRVQVGDVVAEGQTLVVVEAMKMEHAIKAPTAGRVTRVCFGEGQRVSQGDRLIELEA